MADYIDLHVHSNCSDGTFTPAQLAAYAKEKNLRAFALTDHDTTEGIRAAKEAGEAAGVQVISGIELSTTYHKKDIHIIGLGIQAEDMHFQDELLHFQDSRDVRNLKLIDKLKEYGIGISHEEMLAAFGDAVWTRAHFARYLLDHRYVKSMKEAFERYLGDRAKCFVAREKVTPYQAIRVIHESGGKAVLAHPLLYHMSLSTLEETVKELAACGLDALEAIYSTNRWTDESNLKQMAKRQGLKISGGSDFHGSNKPEIDLGVGKGNLKISYDIWTNLKE